MEFKIKPQADVNVYIVLGYDAIVLKSFVGWLQEKEHYLVIIDRKKALNLQDNADYPNLITKDIDAICDVTTFLKEIAWQFIFLNIELIILPSFKQNEKMIASQIAQRWPKIKTGVHLSAASFADYKLPDLSSAMQNIHSKLEFALLSNLKGFFKKTPAVICGAGPSLDKSFLQMKEKALIFSGGSALSALNGAPHFIGLVDRETPLDFFQKSFKESFLFFLLKAPNAILQKSFRKKFLCFAKENYLFFKLIIDSIKLDFDAIDTGWSTLTFLTALAVYFGCDPIIFNGVDLSFKSTKIYSDGVAQASYDKKERQSFVNAKNVKQEDVKTQNDWFMSALFLQKLTERNSEITFYSNALEGLSLGDKVKLFSIDAMKDLPSINLKQKLDCLESSANITIDDDLNRQILDLIEKELKTVDADLLELEKMYNGQIDKLKSRPSSWCEENVLMALWDIFKVGFLRNESKNETYHFKEKVQKALFFKDVLTQHEKQLRKY